MRRKLKRKFKALLYRFFKKFIMPHIATILKKCRVVFVFQEADTAIGHMAQNTFKYMLLNKAGVYNENPIYIFQPVSANKYYLKLITNGLFSLQLKWLYYHEFRSLVHEFDLVRELFCDEILFAEKQTTAERNCLITACMNHNPIKNFLPYQDLIENTKLLAKMGITEDDWFICFFARDSYYYKKTKDPLNDNSQRNHRDSDINDCIMAAEYITSLGGFALRMGQDVEKFIETDNKNIIDYSRYYRTEKADILITAKCKFVLGSASGYTDLAIFGLGIPAAFHNFFNFHESMNYFDLNISKNDKELEELCSKLIIYPKILFSTTKNRILTLSEIFELTDHDLNNYHEFKDHGITLIDNSPEEILELAKEMNARIDGVYKSTLEENELRRKAYNISKRYPRKRHQMIPYAGCYLRKYKDLIV